MFLACDSFAVKKEKTIFSDFMELSLRQTRNRRGKSSVSKKPSGSRPKAGPFGGTGLSGAVQTLGQIPPFQLRQFTIPSATAFTVSGTGAAYSATTGAITGTTNNVFWSLYFRLADLTQASTEFGPMFDQYKIAEVKVHLHPQMRVNYQGAAGVFQSPVFTAVDYDDSSTPTNMGYIFEYQNVEIHDAYKPFTVSLKPRIAVNTGTGFVNQSSGWIDMADQTVMHYGLKGAFPWLSASSAWNIFVEYVILLRSVR